MASAPDSNGCRSTSRTVIGNSGASSRKSTPCDARATAPGRMSRLPPPPPWGGRPRWGGGLKTGGGGGGDGEVERGGVGLEQRQPPARQANGSRPLQARPPCLNRATVRVTEKQASSYPLPVPRAARGDGRPPPQRAVPRPLTHFRQYPQDRHRLRWMAHCALWPEPVPPPSAQTHRRATVLHHAGRQPEPL